MGKGNWKCKVTASASNTSNTVTRVTGTCIWDSNDWSYDMNNVTGKVTVNSNTKTVFDNGHIDCSSNHTQTLGSHYRDITRGHADQTITVSAEIISKSTYSSGDKTASTTIKVPKKPSYSVTYSASGASNIPASQTKWYGENLTLSITKPTKTGYTFSRWVSGNSGYNAGAVYTENAALALTAQWNENTATLNYNANGGSLASGMSNSVTMRYSQQTTIQNGVPTKTGYTFLGWSTSSTATSASYTAGNTYKAANVNPSGATLYAVWRINTWTVTYNANGGSGAPNNQTKTYNQNLTLSTTKPTKTAYNFKGWSTTLNGSVVYQPGATYTGNAALNLYAVWELAHIKPIITSNNTDNTITAYRCDSSGVADDEGQNIRVIFNWKTEDDVTSVQIRYKLSTATSFTNINVSASGKSDTVDQVIGSNSLSTEEIYQVKAYVSDGSGGAYENESAIVNIPPPTYPIDVLRGGKGIAFGGVANEEDVMDVYFKAKFRKIIDAFDDIYLQDAKYLKGYDSNNNLIFLIRAYDNKTAVGDATKETRIWSNVIPTINVGGTVYNVAVDKVLNYMAIKLSANVDVQCNSQIWNPNINVPFNTIQKSIGNGLTFVNNGIKIGTGIKQVRVSGCTMQHNLNNTNTSIVGIFHNSNILSSGYLTGKDKGFTTLCFPPLIIDVNQNDVITMKYGSDTANSTFRFAAGVHTQLVVEAI